MRLAKITACIPPPRLRRMTERSCSKYKDTVKAAVDQVRFEKVVENDAGGGKERKITTNDIPQMVDSPSADYGMTKRESSGILDHLIPRRRLHALRSCKRCYANPRRT